MTLKQLISKCFDYRGNYIILHHCLDSEDMSNDYRDRLVYHFSNPIELYHYPELKQSKWIKVYEGYGLIEFSRVI